MISAKTVEEVLSVVNRHVDRETLLRIVNDLLDVPGNASFRDSVRALAERTGVLERVR